MEPNDLKTPEICYELRSRGIYPENNQLLRRAQLRAALKRERSGSVYTLQSVMNFKEESEEIETTLSELMHMLVGEDVSLSSTEIRRANSRLMHVEQRCSRLKPVGDEQADTLANFEAQLLVISGLLIEQQDNSLTVPIASSTMHNPSAFTNSNVSSSPPVRSVPVYKWGIQFSGPSNKESVMSFLEKIADLRESRNISEEELYTSAIDLFTGTARLWFRSIRKETSSWDDIVRCLRRDFLPVDYEDDLWAEIRSRTQGPKENVLQYIICVESLFNRLSTPPSESDIVKQIRKNLHPYFTEKLVLIETGSLSDLKHKCRSIQELKVRAERYSPPPIKHSGLLEPDLACLSLNEAETDTTRPSNPWNLTVAPISCWNCQSLGHSHRECSNQRTIFCYRCGTKGKYSSDCPKCNPKNVSNGADLSSPTGQAPSVNPPLNNKAIPLPLSPPQPSTFAPRQKVNKKETPSQK